VLSVAGGPVTRSESFDTFTGHFRARATAADAAMAPQSTVRGIEKTAILNVDPPRGSRR